ncbi:MAG: dephospho-CoA kinase [Deltaproteobacteria bacterium]|nr:dephospho-CoA kinase [Deltaproteobacteria bacterium]
MVIGLTGGPATGKSLVTAEFKRLGAAIVDADVIAREITQKGAPAYDEICREFGAGVLLKDGSLDRKALGRLIFADDKKRKRLNEITHPGIRARIRQEVEAFKESFSGMGLVVVDAPLLFEAGLDKEMDSVIVVYADEERQVERLKARDLSEDEARRIIAAQMPVKEKVKKTDYIIDNSGDRDAAIKQAGELYKKLCKK